MFRVSAKSASVSPGKPTMKSPEMAMSGRAARTRSMIRKYDAVLWLRFIALSTRSLPDCTGRWR
jgi:hypothetical protein